jgi:tetratricopeptide (TPR) repeat protein
LFRFHSYKSGKKRFILHKYHVERASSFSRKIQDDSYPFFSLVSFLNKFSPVFNNQQPHSFCLLIVGLLNLSIRDDTCKGKQLTNHFYKFLKEHVMQPSALLDDKLGRYYTTAIDALCEIAHSYFFIGRLSDALYLLSTSLHMIEAGEVVQKDRLKLLLLYGRVLNVNHLLHRGDTDLMFSTILQAKQVAEAAQDQQGLADALSLLGQARCNATTIAIVKSGGLPFGTQGQGKYEEALAYQQEALSLQETLNDTRGISESHFGIGLVYQFWQQNELAREHFIKAIQVAEQYGHVLEQAEPNRHLTIDALFKGDLDQALIHAQRALSFREAGGFRPYQPLDHLTLRDIYLKKGDTARAEFHMQQASALAEEMGLSALLSSIIDTTSRVGEQREGA